MYVLNCFILKHLEHFGEGDLRLQRWRVWDAGDAGVTVFGNQLLLVSHCGLYDRMGAKPDI
jgi:hypothetical protein